MTVISQYNDAIEELELLKNRFQLINEISTFFDLKQKEINGLITYQKKAISEIEKCLKKFSGIEYKIYYKAVINGFNPTAAVERVAEEISMSSSTIWNKYYPNVKKEIKKSKEILDKSSDFQVN